MTGVSNEGAECDRCTSIGTFGLAYPSHPRLVAGQHVGHDGLIHDPVFHETWCPVAREGDDA